MKTKPFQNILLTFLISSLLSISLFPQTTNADQFIKVSDLEKTSREILNIRSNPSNVIIGINGKKKINLSWSDYRNFANLDGVKIKERDRFELLTLSELPLLKNPRDAILFLDFENESPDSLEDKSSHFQVLQSNFILLSSPQYRTGKRKKNIKTGITSSGKFAFFVSEKDRIELIPRKDRARESNKIYPDLNKSFGIHFLLWPRENREEMDLLNFGNFYGNRYYSFEVTLENRQLSIQLNNILRDNKGSLFSRELSSNTRLSSDRWNRVFILYDKNNSRLLLYINNNLDKIIYLTEDGSKNNPNLFFAMPKLISNKITICGNYKGYTDKWVWIESESDSIFEKIRELNIDPKSQPLYNITFYNKKRGRIEYSRGIFTSSILDLENYGAKLVDFTMKAMYDYNDSSNNYFTKNAFTKVISSDTTAKVQVRMSNFLYPNNNTLGNPPWIDLDLSKEKVSKKIEGRFFQWRIFLYGNYDGLVSPAIKKIEFNFNKRSIPPKPMSLRVVSVEHEQIQLAWKRPLHKDFTGYRIYYGLQPDNFQGMIDFISGNRITYQNFGKGDTIYVTINNKVINENKNYLKSNELANMPFPPIRNQIKYFFHIVAYDDYGFFKKNPKSTYSPLSNEVSARPFLR